MVIILLNLAKDERKRVWKMCEEYGMEGNMNYLANLDDIIEKFEAIKEDYENDRY